MAGTISAKDAQELVSGGEVDVVDVREAHETVSGRIPGARVVPLGRLRSDPDGAALGRRVLFVCESGRRSEQAAELAGARGVGEAYSLEGGMAAWRAAGLPIERPESSRAEEAPPPDLDAVAGANLARLRAERGLSLDVVAGLTGVSRQTLGQIENGRMVPSLGTLWKIAHAFGVTFSALIAQPARQTTLVFSRANAKPITDGDGRFSSRPLFSPDEKGGVEFYELFLAARSRQDAEPHAPGTRENLLVTDGRLVVELGSERYELGKGDAIAFTADVPHAYVNPSNEACWMSLVMTYSLAGAT